MAERLANPGAVLSRTDLRELGYERRAIDAIFRACPVELVPGYSRPLTASPTSKRFARRKTSRCSAF